MVARVSISLSLCRFEQFANRVIHFHYSLTKDYRNRPKYPELLEMAFIKMYESADVDVAAWFAHTNNQQSNNTELRR